MRFFVIFGRNLSLFSLENAVFFEIASQATNSFHFRFQHSKPRSLPKMKQKLHKTFKKLNFLGFCLSGSQFDAFFIEKFHLFLQKSSLDNRVFPFERFEHSKPRNLSKIRQKQHKNYKISRILPFCHFWGLRGQPKTLKISKNAYHTKPILRQLNSIGETL